jgi:lipoprotein-anchoring transpeptidase ErfK/SrfK
MKKFFSILMCAMAFAMFAVDTAEAKKRKRAKARPPAIVQVHVDISSQSMNVRVNGSSYANWKVSTGVGKHYTPRGNFGVSRMHRVYFSKKYDNAPMPNAVFFYHGFAIHGTGHIRALGRPASHGCVRLHPANAAKLYALVQRHGMNRTRISLTN